jgi:hypothetical protein
MLKKLTQNQELREDIKGLFWVLLISLAMGIPVTYLMYHPLI